MSRAAAALAVALLLACSSRSRDEAAKHRVFSSEEAARPAASAFDPAKPEQAIALPAGEAARRLGSFEWVAAVDWTFTRDSTTAGAPPARLHAAEHHELRQAAGGEFSLETHVDPGLGPGSTEGRRVIFAGGMTYARSDDGPFRERPTDHGRDAQRFRDESFRLFADVAALLGPGLRLEPDGEAVAADRTAKRYRVALAPGVPSPPPAARTFAAGGPDADTRRHLAFLENRVPLSADGELLLDAVTGVPLRARLKATFGVKDDSTAHAEVELLAQVKAIGSAVAAVTAPERALGDVRKPPGVEGALEAAGLKKHGAEEGGRAEPGDEGE
jgi:hypothetical protein